jgi:single-stranded-DNA-specific exonuclease
MASRVLIIEGNDWHTGVIGIIAARIVERYGKPCILISTTDNESKGSGRSIKGFSLFEAVSACSDLLSRFGGHEQAAGLSLSPENIDLFRKRINEYAAQKYPKMPVPELKIDFKLRPSQVDVGKLNLISALEPLGAGNPQPVFGLFDMKLDNIMPIGQGKHLRLSVSRDDVRLSVCRFNTTCESFPFECGQIVNLVVTMERNEYRGVVSPTLLLKDIRSAELEQEELIDDLQSFEAIVRLFPASRLKHGFRQENRLRGFTVLYAAKNAGSVIWDRCAICCRLRGFRISGCACHLRYCARQGLYLWMTGEIHSAYRFFLPTARLTLTGLL